jgi:hypothetical protein
MPKPACIKCQRFFRPKHNGVIVLEQMPKEPRALAGTSEPHNWRPYKVWRADSWICEGCGVEIITGWAARATWKHEPEFQHELGIVEVTINDC